MRVYGRADEENRRTIAQLMLPAPGGTLLDVGCAAGEDAIRLRDHIVSGLRAIPGLTCTYPEGAFYVYPNVSGHFGRGGIHSPADFARRLLNDGHVATVPGEGFGTTEHIRISYATAQKELDRGLEKLRGFVGSL